MKKVIFASLLFAAFFSVACNDDKKELEANWLSALNNPFIGKWKSDIPSANTTLIFDYKTDGTFAYEMVGVPAEQGGVGVGGYLVKDNIQITFLEFEGIAGYTFKVIDNNTIDVTEIIEVKEGGELVLGSTSPFTRVVSSMVIKENRPNVLINPFLGEGKWVGTIPNVEDPEHPFEGVAMTFEPDGSGLTTFGELAANFNYFIVGNYLATFVSGENEYESYSFSVLDNNAIEVTEITGVKDGSIVFGNTVTFIRK
ncbi:hypothetical protein Barb7_00848 [Bacteroidales bacterium Barb7]|nr:hypothetical protein Barb4_02869 [Bacteroidales bacterium Barb4]OAV75529.1 hypothetical protein Barb7_00848 [Bacteroidales bacterium Barb7]